MLGARRVLVVHGVDGLDEITVGGQTDVTEAAGAVCVEFSWLPADFGLATSGKTAMLVEDSREPRAGQISAGRPGPARDVVVANAAATRSGQRGRRVARPCAARAAEGNVDSGAAAGLLAGLSNGRIARSACVIRGKAAVIQIAAWACPAASLRTGSPAARARRGASRSGYHALMNSSRNHASSFSGLIAGRTGIHSLLTALSA